jgi:hypothetical protein
MLRLFYPAVKGPVILSENEARGHRRHGDELKLQMSLLEMLPSSPTHQP